MLREDEWSETTNFVMSTKGISPQNYPGGGNAMYHRIIGLRVELLLSTERGFPATRREKDTRRTLEGRQKDARSFLVGGEEGQEIADAAVRAWAARFDNKLPGWRLANGAFLLLDGGR
jgi:hypothetical protein